jgi:hypothetical protein
MARHEATLLEFSKSAEGRGGQASGELELSIYMYAYVCRNSFKGSHFSLELASHDLSAYGDAGTAPEHAFS